jgi:hypothetical protein
VRRAPTINDRPGSSVPESRAYEVRGLGGWLRPQILWTALLVGAICFEGLGRKFLPEVPAAVFYFLKDAVLLLGLVGFGLPWTAMSSARVLYHGFGLTCAAAFVWTVLETLNPAHRSAMLAVLGLRSYWLWWVAPMLVAGVLARRRDRERAVTVLAAVGFIVAANAAIQFAQPASAQTYALYEGEEIIPIATVATTGRARVSSTFSYLSGFTDFVVLVPGLLLSLGLTSSIRAFRVLALSSTVVTIAVMPMTGSRSPVVLAIGTIALVIWSGGLWSRAMRRAVIAALLAAALAFVVSPEAIEGVQYRFGLDDTRNRFAEILELLPPFAIIRNEHPLLGIGTGMQQNARVGLQVSADFESEGEPGRYLIELGDPGYLLVWFARLGLAVALLRAATALRGAGRGAVAGAATAYAFFAMQGTLAFDHVFQALFFVGAGCILAEVIESRREASTQTSSNARSGGGWGSS